MSWLLLFSFWPCLLWSADTPDNTQNTKNNFVNEPASYNFKNDFTKLNFPYQETKVLSFENFAREKKQLADYFRLRVSAGGEFGLDSNATLIEGAGAPVKQGSRSFVAVVYQQKDFLPLYLDLKKPFVCPDFVGAVSLWVYGTESYGSLHIVLSDNNRDKLILALGNLDFRGWKKLNAEIPAHFMQIDMSAHENRTFQIESIFYVPPQSAERTRFLGSPLVFFIDDLSVWVRPKFIWNFEK